MESLHEDVHTGMERIVFDTCVRNFFRRYVAKYRINAFIYGVLYLCCATMATFRVFISII